MKKNTLLTFRFFLLFFTLHSFCFKLTAFAAEPPDTVFTGIYITSIHDIDFKQKEYTVNLWLWLKYKNKDFDFLQNLEVPQAKTVTKSYSTLDTTGERIYILMKLQCVMKDSWKIDNFPFDSQKLRFAIENSQFDSKTLVFIADTMGKHYDPKFTLNGWDISGFTIKTGNKAYETAFGDPELSKPHSEYSSFKITMELSRKAMGLFWKMFIGMYIAFLIAFVCFFIHAESVEARFGLGVGALFAAVGNKYVIDSSLPESKTFTLVDSLHGITLLFIFGIIVSNIYTLHLVKKDIPKSAGRFDKLAWKICLTAYVLLNVYFIYEACHGS